MTDITALWLLFSSSFLSATILPGSSELTLITLINENTTSTTYLIIVATIGNGLGGFSNYLIGRFFSENTSKPKKRLFTLPWNYQLSDKTKARGRRYGPFILLFSWLPIIGDPLCLVAGYLRFNWLVSAAIITLSKFLRYYFIVFIFNQF